MLTKTNYRPQLNNTCPLPQRKTSDLTVTDIKAVQKVVSLGFTVHYFKNGTLQIPQQYICPMNRKTKNRKVLKFFCEVIQNWRLVATC